LKVYGKDKGCFHNGSYIISWCVGHLVSLADASSYGEQYKKWDNVPVIPSDWNYVVKENTKEQFNILKKFMNADYVHEVVCATDAGREGELIFWHTYKMAECEKPVKRLWISSLEDSAIRNGFANLRSSKEFDNLYKSALCRERADWLVGINATRFFTTLYKSDKPLSIGRVQTPTLAMLVQRDNDIKNFIKEKYYTVEINCGEYSAFSEKFTDFEQADKLQKLCKIAKAKVVDISTEEKKINTPKLYDLTTLQRDANRIYGFTAQQTLDTVQRLYDSRLSTYPRTDSQYLTEDMEETARTVIKAIISKTKFAEHTQYTAENANLKSVMNNKMVSDHHAIIPTINIATTEFFNLTDMDRKILYLISARLLSATAEQHIYENTTVTLDCNRYKFTARGKTVIRKGYKQISDNFFNCVRIKQDAEDKTLPKIQLDNEYNVTSKTVEHYTQPPKPFTEDTLLSAMERAGNEDYSTDDVEHKGLGTPATRANIIETIISRGYAQRNEKQLIPTDIGKKLIECVPEKLKSAKLTAMAKQQNNTNKYHN
jgi:DNA topoisomerase-3